MDNNKKLMKAKELAGQLFDLKLIDLDKMDEDQKKDWLSKFGMLSPEEFEDVRQQVIKAKLSQQSQIGWQTLPHDLSVLVFCLVSIFVSLKVGVIYGITILTMLVSLSQVYYNEALYKVLGYSVWLTYPAYLWLGYTLYLRGMSWWQVLLIIALAWGGTFLLQTLLSIPMQMFLRTRAQTNRIEQEKKAKAHKNN
jgi:hypothetical protein